MLNFSPLDGATFPLSGNPGATFNCSLVGSSNASASTDLEDISGPVVISLVVFIVAVSSSLLGADFESESDFLADLGEVVEIVRRDGIGGRC
jgi:hypothetical protein